MIPTKVTYGVMVGGAVGAFQSIGMRQLDINMVNAYTSSLTTNTSTPLPFLAKSLGNFGSPSVDINLLSGALALGIAYYANKKGKLGDAMNGAILSYGATTLVGGIANGLFPTASWSAMVKASNPSGSSSTTSGTTGVPTASAVLIRTSSTSSTGSTGSSL